MSSLIGSAIPGATGTYSSIGDAGISIQSDGTLSFDTTKFEDALSTDPTSVASLFNTTSNNSSAGIMSGFEAMVDQMTGSTDSVIDAEVSGFQSRSEKTQDEEATLKQQISDYQTRLQSQFSNLESQINKYKSLDSTILNAAFPGLGGSSSSSSSSSSNSGLSFGTLDIDQAAWAASLLQPFVKTAPTRELDQIAGRIAIRQDRLADALADLEQAQALGADQAAPLRTVRSELGELISVASRLALESAGPKRQDAVAHALRWGARWREIDPASSQCDMALGDLMLGIGDPAGAWRQLSTMIERDPMSGSGYEAIANVFEREGKVTEALGYWEQALRLDQTDPTPRLRKAQALFALGREHDGVVALRDITDKHWHERWWSTVSTAEQLLQEHHGM